MIEIALIAQLRGESIETVSESIIIEITGCDVRWHHASVNFFYMSFEVGSLMDRLATVAAHVLRSHPAFLS